MAVMDAQALTTDTEGLAFLADVIGTADLAAAPGRRFPMEAWVKPVQIVVEERLDQHGELIAEFGCA